MIGTWCCPLLSLALKYSEIAFLFRFMHLTHKCHAAPTTAAKHHADEIAKYEEALQFLKQNSQDGKLPTMKDLRSEKELLVQQKSAQYETYQYFKDYHRELQTVCSNVENILNQPSVQKHATREFTL